MKFVFLLSRLFHLYSPQFEKVVLNETVTPPIECVLDPVEKNLSINR
jgi:hypothetical protein